MLKRLFQTFDRVQAHVLKMSCYFLCVFGFPICCSNVFSRIQIEFLTAMVSTNLKHWLDTELLPELVFEKSKLFQLYSWTRTYMWIFKHFQQKYRYFHQNRVLTCGFGARTICYVFLASRISRPARCIFWSILRVWCWPQGECNDSDISVRSSSCLKNGLIFLC